MKPAESSPTAALVQLRRRVDEHFAAAVARSPDGFACREGCSACCGVRISVFAVEAVAVRDALARLALRDPEARDDVRRQALSNATGCPLLRDDRCVVYESRPLICRSHGLPVVQRDDDGAASLAWCPLNFTDPGAPPPRESVLSLDAVNLPLATIAQLWDGSGERVALADLALAHDRGDRDEPAS